MSSDLKYRKPQEKQGKSKIGLSTEAEGVICALISGILFGTMPLMAKTAYTRKAGYSKKFFETYRKEITLHKAARQAFDDLGVKKIPKVKDLNEKYARLLSGKKTAYAEYRKQIGRASCRERV